MGPAELLGTSALSVAGCMVGMWLLSLVLRDASIVDIFWGLGFVVIATVALLSTQGDSPRRLLLAGFTALWGLRLAGYLLWRNVGHGEDRRYVAMRRYWGARFPWVSLFTVFGLQGVLMWVVSLPVQLGQVGADGPLNPIDVLGVMLFGLGFLFEAIGDFQLARFLGHPANKGHVMDRGLWRYTRHPNYFGDFCAWWGLFVIAISSPYGIYSIVGPLVMSFLLMRVSGVPMLERNIHKRRPEYYDYVRKTSAFFPRPPRRIA